MTDPTPYTDDELADVRAEWEPLRDERPVADEILSLLATVDAERARREQAERELAALRGDYERLRAERDAARADRVCWRENHNQVAAERDALRAVVRHWHESLARLAAGTEKDALWPMSDWTDGEWDESGWTSAEADAIRRALDASPTEGNPE